MKNLFPTMLFSACFILLALSGCGKNQNNSGLSYNNNAIPATDYGTNYDYNYSQSELSEEAARADTADIGAHGGGHGR